MRVLNIHERLLRADISVVGPLIDGLATDSDRLWPRDTWPPMKLDRPLSLGATGGHGPIRYTVEAYTPGRHVSFRFLAPRGFDGRHWLDAVPASPSETIIRHGLEMTTCWPASLTWPFVFRPLHDALSEDGLTRAEAVVGMAPIVNPWSIRVRLLRWAIAGRKARPQTLFATATDQRAARG